MLQRLIGVLKESTLTSLAFKRGNGILSGKFVIALHISDECKKIFELSPLIHSTICDSSVCDRKGGCIGHNLAPSLGELAEIIKDPGC